MLAIRMQRTGRKGHAQFRMIVQEARLTPTSGRIVAPIGSYNPHSKAAIIDKDKVSFYLEHGAQPSDRVARLLQKEGVKLPSWVKVEASKSRALRNPQKLRKNRPAEEKAPVPEEAAAPQPAVEEAPTVETEAVAPEEAAEAAPEQVATTEPTEEPKSETTEKPAEPADTAETTPPPEEKA